MGQMLGGIDRPLQLKSADSWTVCTAVGQTEADPKWSADWLPISADRSVQGIPLSEHNRTAGKIAVLTSDC